MAISSLFVLMLGSACLNRVVDGPHDTPTSGSIHIAVDESLVPVVVAEVQAFESIYRDAHIAIHSVPGEVAIQLLVADSVRLAVVARPLNELEKQKILAQRITPHEMTVAKESVAIILNPAAKDSLLTTRSLIDVFSGIGKHRVVFDNPNSSIVRFVKDSLLAGKAFSESTYSLKSNKAVIEYVSKQKDAIGLIGGAWIGDRDDPAMNKFLESIRVAAVEYDGEYYQPYQAHVARGLYPLTRNIVLCSREARSGLASGFMSFVGGDKGQRVILKSGLVPVTMPIRVVQVTNEPL